MRYVYKCDFCKEVFDSKLLAEEHEEKCGYNPKNKIDNKIVFRLSMIHESLANIIACALYEVAKDELVSCYLEAERATTTNCPYTILGHKQIMLNELRSAEDVKRKHKGRNSNTYKDVEKEYPELLKAMIDTLERKAWNER